MDAYLSRLMNDNVNPDSLFDDEYYLFAGEGSDVDGMEHDELEDSSSGAPAARRSAHAVPQSFELSSLLAEGGGVGEQSSPWPCL
ncbi:hypothetical protein TRIUR3_00900 [Triticum urartu]|uniref:Uncharacterized protein n=2 Tax=Triticum TaxID=4564 RepID=A0A9R1AWR8_TRITD|nr:hypothetical protein TRIUR3_00900 [Triticum urartu]VAI43075.1 unnamed protein product [Triticum turgidum subsp. durum]